MVKKKFVKNKPGQRGYRRTAGKHSDGSSFSAGRPAWFAATMVVSIFLVASPFIFPYRMDLAIGLYTSGSY